jgi:hypothetical protein
MDIKKFDLPAAWGETLLAVLPFLLLPTVYLFGLLLSPFINSQPDPTLALGIFLSILGVFLLAMLIGWVKGFPRWVFPYWGFILLVTLYMWGFSGTIAGYHVDGSFWAWTPLVAIAMIGTLWARGFAPLYVLLKSVWKDWTLLSFTFYGALPLLFLFAYDEVHGTPFEYIVQSVTMLILAVGAAIYMRTENIWHRFASLVGGFSIGWLAVMIHLGIYWNGRQLFWMSEPGSWIKTLNWTSQMGAVLMLILVAPLLVALLHQILKVFQNPNFA